MTARASAGSGVDRRDPLLRLISFARPMRGRLVLAAAAGALATGCGAFIGNRGQQ